MMTLYQIQNIIIPLPKMTNLLQYNIRCLQANRDELDLLVSHIHLYVLFLQETFLKKDNDISFKGFSSYHSFVLSFMAVLQYQ